MGATFSRLKNWIAEVLTNADLNAEIDNILTYLTPAGVDDYSATVAQMKIQTSPGAQGSESLATSMGGELERLRYVIQRLIGSSATYWYDTPPSTLSDLIAAIGTGLPTYRIVSGKTTGNSSQLCALIPSGTTASVTLSASTTPFVYYIGGTQYSITADVTLTGLSLAPASNNTCSVNNTAAAGQQWTRMLGMHGTIIDVDGMNSSVANVVGTLAGFKAGTEYFLAFANSTLSLTSAWRGGMFNNAGANITSAGVSDNAEVKLMRLAWIFATTNSTLAVTYTNPSISGKQPTSPSTGDYWFDLSSTAWKTYNSTTWIPANATLIGVTMQDTAACVAARTFDSYKSTSPLNTAQLEWASNSVLRASDSGVVVSIFGIPNSFGAGRPQWDAASDMESAVTEAANTDYFFYMKENGTTVISDKAPLSRRELSGLYHPGETWRCLGSAFNNNSTNFETSVVTFRDIGETKVIVGSADAYVDNSKTATTTQGFMAQDCFPNFYQQVVSLGTQYTAAQGQYQDVVTATITRGLWKLSGFIDLNLVGTASGTCHLDAFIGITAGTASSVIESNLVNISHLSVPAGSINAEVFGFVPNFPVWVSASTTFYLKYNVNTTAGATYTATKGRLVAERIDDIVGMP
jgi:hypothetical protein